MVRKQLDHIHVLFATRNVEGRRTGVGDQFAGRAGAQKTPRGFQVARTTRNVQCCFAVAVRVVQARAPLDQLRQTLNG